MDHNAAIGIDGDLDTERVWFNVLGDGDVFEVVGVHRSSLENFFDGLCFDCSELSVALVVGRSFDSTDAITFRCFDEILKLLVFFFE